MAILATRRRVFRHFSWMKIAAMVLVAMVLIFASGCGGGGMGSTTPPPPEEAPSHLSYPTTTIIAVVGEALTANVPSVTGAVTSYSVSPSLPAGLTFSTSTGAIAGTPTATSDVTYTVTASNSAGSTTAKVTIKVNEAPPSDLVYPVTTINAYNGAPITPDLPTVNGTGVAFSLVNALPEGLAIHSGSGGIYGTPDAVRATATYTVTASNPSGSTTATLTITVNPAVAPTHLDYPVSAISATVGTAISADIPTVDGTPSHFAISPALPAGLTLDSTTGTISGTPTVARNTETYTVAAINLAGSTRTTIEITINPEAPADLVYPVTTIDAVFLEAIAKDTPTFIGAPVTFTVSPTLPLGLAINPSSGEINGTPKEVTTSVTYTVTATNINGSTTANLVIAIAPQLPTISYAASTIAGSVGIPIISDKATITDGGESSVTLSVSPALPTGLTLDSVTGTISGTPTTVSSPASYTVTATNPAGSAAASVTIGVSTSVRTLLDLGHAGFVRTLRKTKTRVLSMDDSRWLLFDYASGNRLASGTGIDLVDVEGSIFALYTSNTVEIRSTVDGHLLFTLPLFGVAVANDGSYVASLTSTAIIFYSPSGAVLSSHAGYYPGAKVFALPGMLLVAQGPEGANVIETISVSDGSSTVGPAFSGNFDTWFLDGQKFLTVLGNDVWTYSNASVEQALVTLSEVGNLQGIGNWIWSSASGGVTIYPIGSTTSAGSAGEDGYVYASGTTLGVLAYGYPSVTIFDLSGTTLTSATYTTPMTYLYNFAANSASEWIVASEYGVVFDGESSLASPRYFTYGAPTLAGSSGEVAIGAAQGTVLFIDPATLAQVGTPLPILQPQVAISSDGSVLAVGAGLNGAQYAPDTSLYTYSLPSNTLINKWPYSVTDENGWISFLLSSDGSTLSQVFGTPVSPQRMVTPVSGAPVTWTDSGYSSPAWISPDGTLIAAMNSSTYGVGVVTSIYKNGVLVTAFSGGAIGWFDNNQLLVNTYVIDPFGNSQFANCTIYNAAGVAVTTTALPELHSFQAIPPGLLYSPEQNQVYSLSTGAVTWSTAYPYNGQGTVAGPYVVYQSGDLILEEKY